MHGWGFACTQGLLMPINCIYLLVFQPEVTVGCSQDKEVLLGFRMSFTFASEVLASITVNHCSPGRYHACMHACIRAWGFACVHEWGVACMHGGLGFRHACMHACMHAWGHAVFVCTHACVYGVLHARMNGALHACKHACRAPSGHSLQLHSCIFHAYKLAVLAATPTSAGFTLTSSLNPKP